MGLCFHRAKSMDVWFSRPRIEVMNMGGDVRCTHAAVKLEIVVSEASIPFIGGIYNESGLVPIL